MARVAKDPRYCVISMRVTNEEKEEVDKLARAGSKSVSDVLRHTCEAANLFKRKGRGKHEQ